MAIKNINCHPEQASVAQREPVLSEVEGDLGGPIRADARKARILITNLTGKHYKPYRKTRPFLGSEHESLKALHFLRNFI